MAQSKKEEMNNKVGNEVLRPCKKCYQDRKHTFCVRTASSGIFSSKYIWFWECNYCRFHQDIYEEDK